MSLKDLNTPREVVLSFGAASELLLGLTLEVEVPASESARKGSRARVSGEEVSI